MAPVTPKPPLRLERGDVLNVMDGRDGGGVPLQVCVMASSGFAELLTVSTASGRVGLIARKCNGDWWWLRTLDEEPLI